MSILDILKITAIIVGGLSALAGVLGYLVISYKKSGREKIESVVNSSDQLTGFWRDQVEGFKEMVATQNEKIRTLTGEVGELRGQLNEKTKQAEEYKLIFQGQNPEMKQFMQTMLDVAKQSQAYMTEDKKFKEDQHNALMAILAHLSPPATVVADGVKFEGTIKKN